MKKSVKFRFSVYSVLIILYFILTVYARIENFNYGYGRYIEYMGLSAFFEQMNAKILIEIIANFIPIIIPILLFIHYSFFSEENSSRFVFAIACTVQILIIVLEYAPIVISEMEYNGSLEAIWRYMGTKMVFSLIQCILIGIHIFGAFKLIKSRELMVAVSIFFAAFSLVAWMDIINIGYVLDYGMDYLKRFTPGYTISFVIPLLMHLSNVLYFLFSPSWNGSKKVEEI